MTMRTKLLMWSFPLIAFAIAMTAAVVYGPSWKTQAQRSTALMGGFGSTITVG
jgi:hypothetical protein